MIGVITSSGSRDSAESTNKAMKEPSSAAQTFELNGDAFTKQIVGLEVSLLALRRDVEAEQPA